MVNEVPHIPVIRFGEDYQSLEAIDLADVRGGGAVAFVSQANAGLIRRDMLRVGRATDALRALSCDRLVEICADAGELFLHGDLPIAQDGPTQSRGDFINQLSATSGLPHALIGRNMDKIAYVMTHMRDIIAGLTRGLDLSVIDSGSGEQAGVAVSYFAVTNALGAILPSNSPGVNSLWLPAVAMKVPIVLKPGREEPWTPLRIMRALIAAGFPKEAVLYYPTGHDGSNTIIQSCGRLLLFGDEKTVSRYAGNPAVEVHGPGRSKVLVGQDQMDHWQDHLDVLVDSVVNNGGRSCINASTIVVPSHGREVAQALAERFTKIQPRGVDDPKATLAGFANAKVAQWIDESIDQHLKTRGATDITGELRSSPRRITRDGATYLLPTVIWCESSDHPLANTEFMFPFTSVVEVPADQMLQWIGPSLVVTAITEDENWIDKLLRCPLIERLNIGSMPTSHVNWEQPHEGNLFEFLYRRRAIQIAPRPVTTRPASAGALG